jgi:predicted acylesterase/phospholipase RssA
MEKKFRIGLTMAGAVSAGAYTGGVMDYFFQALDAWEAAKREGNPSVPMHPVSIDIISGASAGGITGAMAALVLHLKDRNPVLPSKRDDKDYLKENVFYNAWVNLTSDDMLPALLNQDDIERNEKVVSVLNSEFIEAVAKRTLIKVPECTDAPPKYVSQRMELILTLSNLQGFTYELSFSAIGSSKHLMKQHRDYAFFRLGDIYGEDGRIPLNLQKDDVGLSELVQAASATGAFPIGLAYRKFVRKKKYIYDNKDLVFYQSNFTKIKDIHEHNQEEDYVTYCVDGGMLNNEPFDLTMKLMARASSNNEVAAQGELIKEQNAFDSTIIMIDPFPSDDSVVETEPEEVQGREQRGKSGSTFPKFPYGLVDVMGKILGSMRGELLFKGEDIVKAFSKQDFSRFMIAPSRRSKRDKGHETVYNGSVAIACGALGGFAGFFDKRFREHDFYLGRANCQSFLRKYFRVPLGDDGLPENPIFRQGYTREAVAAYRFQDPAEKDLLSAEGKDPAMAQWYVPIIPDVCKDDPMYTETPLPYPAYDMAHFDQHRKAIMSRLKKVALSLNKSKMFSLAAWVIFLVKGGGIFRSLRKEVEQQFRNWNLLP